MWAARAAAEQAERAAMDRLHKMIQNNNDDDESTEANVMRFDEILRSFFVDNLLPLVIWFVELIICIAILAILSVGTYAALYNWVIMRGLEVQSRPIFFDYNAGMGQSHPSPPIGRIDLRSSKRAPWAYACSATDDSFCAIDDDRIKGREELCTDNEEATTKCQIEEEEEDYLPILLPGQRYFFEVTLTLPESSINKNLGVFMLTVNLRSSDKQLLASSKQSSMLPFESNMIAIFRKLSLLLPLSAGLLAETRTITLLAFDNYVDISPKRSLSFVEVTLGVPNPASFPSSLQSIQIQSSKLRYGKEMSPIQEFVRSMRWPCAFLGTIFFFILYVYAALTIWRRRDARRRWNAQPYADFFSNDGSAPNNSTTGHSRRWTGEDIEILEDECSNSENWEPLNESERNGLSEQKEEMKEQAEQIVSDEEEESNSTVDNNAEQMPAKADGAGESSFPFGKIASHKAVKGRPNVFLNQNRSREDEEKSLADMVMKGYTKYEIFTGESKTDCLSTGLLLINGTDSSIFIHSHLTFHLQIKMNLTIIHDIYKHYIEQYLCI